MFLNRLGGNQRWIAPASLLATKANPIGMKTVTGFNSSAKAQFDMSRP